MTKTITGVMFLLLAVLPVQAVENITGRLLNAELTVYEQQARSVLNAVVRVNDGSYILINCELHDDKPQPMVDLREAHALMRAYIAGGSRTSIEATVEKSSSLAGFPTYNMKSWKMPIPGFDAYSFSCAHK